MSTLAADVTPLSIVLELSRTEEADDANAFRFAPQSYTLRTSGGGRELFEVSWDQQLLADLEAVRLPGRDPAVVQRVGEMLHRCLRAVGWKAYSRSIKSAAEAGRTVILTIRSNAAELYVLPWELLTLSGSGQHLGELSHVLVRYEWPETESAAEQPAPRPAGGRILLAWSAAAGAVPALDHQRAIEQACALGHHPFVPEQDVLAGVSIDKLVGALRAAEDAGEPYAVLHLLCHGGQTGSGFGLVVNGEEPGTTATIDAARMRQCLHPFRHSLRLVMLAACDAANTGALGNHLGSIAQTLHRAGIQSVVASRYPLSVAGSTRLTQVLYRTLLAGPSALETALVTARAELAREGGSRSAANLDWASLQYYGRDADGYDTRPIVFRPYRGLLAFHAPHSRFFFGRETERRETLRDMEALRKGGRPRFLVVAGASGTGKSSMVLAGAIPDLTQHEQSGQGVDVEQLLLRARRNLELAARSSGRAALRKALDMLDEEHATREQHSGAWEVHVMRPGGQPLSNLREALASFRNSSRSFMLVIDQFEELFTHTEDAEVRSRFVHQLWALASEDNGFHCIITIRIDFLGRCGEIVMDDSGTRLDKVAYDEMHRVFVAQLGRQQLREAIEGPAQLAGLRLSEGLTERLLADVGHEPGALPLLQYTLDRLWERREGRLLSAKAYDELGGVVGALQQRADSLIDALTPEQQQQARRLMTRLVSFGDDGTDTRKRLPIEQLVPSGQAHRAAFEHALAKLVDARLLVRSEEGGARTLEVAHEALIRKWQRLRDWLQADRVKLSELDKLQAWAQQWDEHKVALTGTRLGYAQEVAERYPDEIDDLTARMIEGSCKRQLQRRRWWIATVVGTIMLGLLFVGLGVMALMQEARAQEALIRAERNAQRAEEKALLARDAQRMAAARSTRDKALAISFMRELESADPLSIPGWRERAALALAQPRTIRRFLGHSATVTTLAHHPQKPQILTGSRDHTARLWDAATGAEVRVLRAHRGPVLTARYSHDGAFIATGGQDGAIWLWRSEDGTQLKALTGHKGPVSSVSFRADGKQLVSGSEDGTVRLWDIDSGRELTGLKVHPEVKTSVMFHPDGNQVAVASGKYESDHVEDKHVRFWDVKTGDTSALKQCDHPISSLALNQRGDAMITGSHNHFAILLPLDGSAEMSLEHHRNDVLSVSFHADGLHVVTGSADRTVLVWSTETGSVLTELAGDLGGVGAVAYSPESDHIVTGSYDGKVRLWRVGSSYTFEPRDQGVFESVTYSPDGTRLAAPSPSGVWLWQAKDGSRVQCIPNLAECKVAEGNVTEGNVAAFSSDGTRLLVGYASGRVRLWSISPEISEEPLVDFKAHDEKVTMVGWSKDGHFITSSEEEEQIAVWDAQGNPATTSPLIAKDVVVVQCGAGAYIATLSSQNVLRVQDSASGEERFSTTLQGEEPEEAVFGCSPDGGSLAAGSTVTGHLTLWRTDTGAQQFYKKEPGAVSALSFTPNGRWLLTGLDTGTITIRATQDGTVALTADRHTEDIVAIAHTPSGSHFATASADGRVQIWENTLQLLESDATAKHPMEHLWLATSVCPNVAERNRFLGATWQAHERDYQSCRTMVSCTRAQGADFDGCLAAFQEAVTEAHQGDPDASITPDPLTAVRTAASALPLRRE